MSVQPRLEYRQFEVWVEVEGAELPCYAVDKDRANGKISCFIESQEGKSFSIHVRKTQRRYGCRVLYRLDGNHVASTFFTPLENHTAKLAYIRTSSETKFPFLFSPIKTTGESLETIFPSSLCFVHFLLQDDNASLDEALLAEQAQSVYQIEVEICHVVNIKRYPKRSLNRTSKSRTNKGAVPEVRAVHESSEKAKQKMHQISYGDQRRIASKGCYVKCDFREVIGVFTFFYRPRHIMEYLQCFRTHQNLAPKEVETRHIQAALPAVEMAAHSSESNKADNSIRHSPFDKIGEPDKPGLHDQSGNAPVEESKQEVAAVKAEDNKDDIDVSSEDETVKALLSAVEKIREMKRKKKRVDMRAKKRAKFEVEAPSFFKPGEAHDVVDLTSD
ncbi:hypothetical protein CVT26_002285 [Gymnopilus dilepis]|uniref:DUF7918 domain-containing protein n=1 Tax=Gymnopilus dilepis TaxID=231916 RepID=A0A409YMX4_9AGAR|nr:hypothetical protein CVT26_002285 [Gymnopilus dilepis]